MRIIRLFLLMLVVTIGATFAVLNAEQVALNYYFGSVELPLALVLSGGLMVG